MPLQFPSNPTINQTYSSGSSATYTWNGTYWQTTLPPTQTILVATSASAASFATSASFATTSSYILNAVSSSYAASASFANTASFVLNAISSSYAASASFALARIASFAEAITFHSLIC